MSDAVDIAVLGAGPAGLTAAHVLSRGGRSGVVFEADDQVGGISRTVEHDGYRFDLGGHRFFTKLKPVLDLWEETLGEDFLTRKRLSRIFYDGRYFSYPLRAEDVVSRLGLVESARCGLSFLWAQRLRGRHAATFEEWVTMRFGRRLYETFFRTYTEKVWGIPGAQLDALWAAQRIKSFSLWAAALTILGLRRHEDTTLIEHFRYPRLGPGQMWEALTERLDAAGVPVKLNSAVIGLRHENRRVRSVIVRSGGRDVEHSVDGVISSIALSDLVLAMDPAPPGAVLEAARRLRYRSLCVVALITTQAETFPDNWIYLHDRTVRAGRVQNYGAWSPDMVRPGMSCLGVEYFCSEGDDVWNMEEQESIDLARTELGRAGLIDPSQVVGGRRVLVPRAYPMYDGDYDQAVQVLREYISGFDNLQTCGRNGLHRYNNQDHSMWTAMLAALNLVDGGEHDVWSVNTEPEYHEHGGLGDDSLAAAMTA